MRRCWFYVLLILFIIGIGIRIFHFPFRESALLRVIPADALVMSRHLSPGPRWSEMLETGLVDPWLTLAGMDSEYPGRDLAQDPGIAWLLSRLGRKYVATAYVERFAGRPAPALIASAWVGGWYTHLARMGFLDDAFPAFRMVRAANGMRIWKGYFPDVPREFAHVSFGIYEGVAFGVATDQPLGAVHLSHIMRRQARSGSEALLSQGSEDLVDAYDRILMRPPFGDHIEAGIVLDAAMTLGLEFYFEHDHGRFAGTTVPTILPDFLSVVAPTTVALAGTTAGNGIRLVEQLPLSGIVQDVWQLLYTHAAGRQENGALAGWIADRDHGGRLMRLRVPAAGFAVEVVREGASVLDIMTPVLQRLHTRYGVLWQLVPHGDSGVFALTPPGDWWYSRLPRGERAGLAVWNGFFVVYSSAEALDRLLAQFRRNAASDPFAIAENTNWYIRVDGPGAGEVLRMGVSSYALWQAIDGQVRDRAREAFLQHLADAIAAYDSAEATLRAQEGGGYRGSVVMRLHEEGSHR